MWGTTGIGYNVPALRERLGQANSWGIVFNPEKISKFADCGVYMLDAVQEIFPAALNYLKLNPDSKSLDDLKKAADLLYSIRPYIKKFHSSEYINALAGGDICLAVGYSGDILQAKTRAEEATKNSGGKKTEVEFMIPQEGAVMWFDNFVIPADAGNPDAAYAFIDFVNRPQIAAKNSEFISYANGNLESQKFLSRDILDNPNIYPKPAIMKQLYTITPYDQKTQAAVNRMWTNIRAKRKPY
jgi:putrescine transport system substrate-binding protein